MKVLFLCTGNSCRSQMAEGYARHFGLEIWEVKSAGVRAQGINPLAIAVMKEDGVDISQQKSTVLTKDLLQWANLVITLCGDANQTCPVLPRGTEKQYWPFEDPAKFEGDPEEILMKFRVVRDAIKSEIIYKIKSQQDIPPLKKMIYCDPPLPLWQTSFHSNQLVRPTKENKFQWPEKESSTTTAHESTFLNERYLSEIEGTRLLKANL